MSRDPSRLLALAALLVLAAFTFVLWRSAGMPGRNAPTAGEPLAALSQSFGDTVQRAELEALAAEVRALRTELELMRQLPRADAIQMDAAHTSEPPAVVAAEEPSELGPEVALAYYVRSFDNGGEGIEFYRLIVQAHAPRLVAPILPHVTSQRSQPLLRLSLTAILGDARLRGDTRVLGALATLLNEVEDARIPAASAASIVRLTREPDAPWIEHRWAHSEIADVRVTLLDHLVRLVGEDPNPCLVRLLASAPDAPARALVIARFAPHAPETALPAFELVQGLDQPTRLAAALRVSEFRTESFAALVQAWRAREQDEAVRRALGAAIEALATVPSYHPEQACGPPDVSQLSADAPQAWASANADAGVEWLEVDFPTAVRANLVRVHETCSSGALQEIVLILDDGSRESAWRGTTSRPNPGAFEVQIQPSRPVRGVRVLLDTARVSGWNEIDSIELVGSGGTFHGNRARASSYYGQGRGSGKGRSEAQALLQGLQFFNR